MPLPKGTKYRMTKSGMRLAFNNKGEVIEAKNMMTGDTHTQSEFKKDKKMKNKKSKK